MHRFDLVALSIFDTLKQLALPQEILSPLDRTRFTNLHLPSLETVEFLPLPDLSRTENSNSVAEAPLPSKPWEAKFMTCLCRRTGKGGVLLPPARLAGRLYSTISRFPSTYIRPEPKLQAFVLAFHSG